MCIPGPSGGEWNDSSVRGRPSTGAGILGAEIYLGRLVWNRHRTLKHPETGERHYAPNPMDALATSDIPELRIVEPEVWDAAQRRLVQHRPLADRQGRSRFWNERRPKRLLTGKVVCGCCGRLFEAIGRDYPSCRGVRRGVCRNNARVRRAKLEAEILTGLETRLMEPRLAQAFAKAFAGEWARLTAADVAAGADIQGELNRVGRKIAHLAEAIAEGGSASRALAAKLLELETRQDALKAVLVTEPVAHPHLPADLGEVYRERVANLHEAMDGGRNPAAVEAARPAFRRRRTRWKRTQSMWPFVQ